MKKMIFGLLICFISVNLVFAAQNEDDEVLRAKNNVKIKKMVADMNTACGTDIEMTIDWDSFEGANWQRYSISSYSGAPLKALNDFCSAEKGNSKAYIQKHVKSITCQYGGEGKSDIKIKKGQIKYIIDFKTKNVNTVTRAALLKGL